MTQLDLFDVDDPALVPPDPMIYCTPVCDWCGLPGPDIPADVFSFGRRHKAGDPWWPMIAFGLISIDEHKRTGCARRDEHPEQLARLLADREPFDRETPDEVR